MSNAFLQALMTPWWAVQLLTGAKSFVDNPLIGSRRLNAWGLHAARVALAQRMTMLRRARLAAAVAPADRAAFDRDGVVVIRDFLPPDQFAALRDQVTDFEGEARETVQGDTITRRFAVDPVAIRAIPAIRAFRANPRWRSLARYVASFNMEPMLYIQAILTQRRAASPDPQINLHADTFYPAMKAWLFLEDVSDATGPFSYVLGSHRLTKERLAWERQRSLTVRDGDCRLSARGSLRVEVGELAALGLPQPTSFAVPANTLVVADTYGFHARGLSAGRTTRLELWAYGRRNPFRPLVGFDPWSLPGIAERRITLRWRARDRIASLVGQPWVRVGRKRPGDE
jgi:hypothetical protein